MVGTFSEWTDRLDIYVKLLKADGQRRKALAEANLLEAKAAGEIFQIRAQKRLLKELDREMRAILRAQRKYKKQIVRIEKDGKMVAKLLGGRCLPGGVFTRAKNLLRKYTEMALIEPVGDALYDIAVPRNATSPINFHDCRNGSSDQPTVPTEIENGLELVDWMLAKRQIPRQGKPAQRVLRKVIGEVNGVAGETAAALKESLDDLDDRIDSWRDDFKLFGNTPAVKTE